MATPPLPAPVEFECEPAACAWICLQATASARTPSQSIGIRELGYAPRPQQELGDLNDPMWRWDSWVAAASCCFQILHTLIDRNGQGSTGTAVRRIHAVVLEPATSKILSLAGAGSFPTFPRGGETREGRDAGPRRQRAENLREGMQIERRVPLDGPLSLCGFSPIN